MKRVILLAILMGGTVAAKADEQIKQIDFSALSPYSYDLQLADNAAESTPPSAAISTSTPEAAPATENASTEEVFHESTFTRNKLHEYLGLGSLGFATLALLSPKERHGPHEYFAKGAAALGGAAVASGLTFHLDDINLSYGLHDPDNVHALLATLGAAGFLVAVSKAPQDGHAVAGAAGYAAMLIGIKFVW